MKFIAFVAVCVAVSLTMASASSGFSECSSSFIASYIPHEQTRYARVCRDRRLAISYDVDMINPAWSAYHITPDDVKKNIPGRDDFYEDPDLLESHIRQAPVDSCAFTNNWNKGHLAPSRIMSSSASSKQATYTMANVAPQGGYFNQHPWNDLESHVFDWVGSNNALYIVTGVAYKSRSHPKQSGCNNITIPDYYFKVICDVTTGEAAGFYADNNLEHDDRIPDFRTVDEVEKIYGGELFPSHCKKTSVNKSYWWGSSAESKKNTLARAANDTAPLLRRVAGAKRMP